MRIKIVAVMLAASCALAASAGTPVGSSATAFTTEGRLPFPDGYREWIYLTSGLDMTYLERQEMGGHSMFDNVFVAPGAYREFMRSGSWPEGTEIVKEARVAAEKGSINRGGKFQSGEPTDVEVHIKDSRRFAGGWAFFAFGTSRAPAAQIPVAADCYSCHRDHGLVDTTFVQ